MIYATLPNLHEDFGWKPGVHKAPSGFLQPWAVIFRFQALACWTRAEARKLWNARRPAGLTRRFRPAMRRAWPRH